MDVFGIEHVRRLGGSAKPRLDSCCGDETDREDVDGEESDREDVDGEESDGVSITTLAAMGVIIALFTDEM